MPTAINAFVAGDIIVYPYRWAAEMARGRSVDGAKDRPCCLVLATTNAHGQTVVFLAPISSKPPRPDQSALVIPDTERRRAGLERYPQAWVYVDEVNQDRPGDSWYLEPQDPLGSFGRPFFSKVAAAVSRNARAGRIVARR